MDPHNTASLFGLRTACNLQVSPGIADVSEMCSSPRRMRAGLAMSQDGLNWARIEGEHHTGALLDVGEEGDWDELFIANPQAGGFPICPCAGCSSLIVPCLPLLCTCCLGVELSCFTPVWQSLVFQQFEPHLLRKQPRGGQLKFCHAHLAPHHSVQRQSPCYNMQQCSC